MNSDVWYSRLNHFNDQKTGVEWKSKDAHRLPAHNIWLGVKNENQCPRNRVWNNK